MIDDAGYGERFIHRTGHGIGIEVHEPPYVVEGDETVLEPGHDVQRRARGSTSTGAFGVRIEDIVAVTDERGRGAEPISPRDLQVVRLSGSADAGGPSCPRRCP